MDGTPYKINWGPSPASRASARARLCIRCERAEAAEVHYCRLCADDYERVFGFRPGGRKWDEAADYHRRAQCQL